MLTVIHSATARTVPPLGIDVHTVAVSPHGAPGLAVTGIVQCAAVVRHAAVDEGEAAGEARERSRFRHACRNGAE